MRDLSPRIEVYCLGSKDKPVCRANLTTSKSNRCPACSKVHRAYQQRGFNRKMRKERKASILFRPHNLTDEKLSQRVREEIRWGTPVVIIAETYGITKKQVRQINCAHYQRHAKMELSA